jgi:hypothetical protein
MDRGMGCLVLFVYLVLAVYPWLSCLFLAALDPTIIAVLLVPSCSSQHVLDVLLSSRLFFKMWQIKVV